MERDCGTSLCSISVTNPISNTAVIRTTHALLRRCFGCDRIWPLTSVFKTLRTILHIVMRVSAPWLCTQLISFVQCFLCNFKSVERNMRALPLQFHTLSRPYTQCPIRGRLRAKPLTSGLTSCDKVLIERLLPVEVAIPVQSDYAFLVQVLQLQIWLRAVVGITSHVS